jgi:hypothetical protein
MSDSQPINDGATAPAADENKTPRAYERSTIEFPYNDLADAMEIARAIHINAGTSCTLDQLAAYTRQSMTSGAFRGRVANAGTFHLTENERGEVKLSELGRRIVEPARADAAKVEAFLSVPLYERVFEHFKGYTLPPPAALGRYMNEVGVASKQTDKARQAFMRSARQAGFFAHGEDRLVRPVTADAGPGTKPIDQSPSDTEKNAGEKPPVAIGGGGNGSGTAPHADPLIAALIQKLPNSNSTFDADQRVAWLQLMAMAFQVAYGSAVAIEIKKSN